MNCSTKGQAVQAPISLRQRMAKLSKTRDEIYHNARMKKFPKVGVLRMTYSRKAVFKEPGWESSSPSPRLGYDRGKMGENPSEESMRRAKNRVFEYAMLNKFEYFFTWTLNKELIDRYDPAVVSKKIQIFLRNAVARKNLRYVLIPEYHKDGAIHLHGLVSGDLKMKKALRPNGTPRRDRSGRTIWNICDWRWGWSTAIRLDGSYEKASQYITKYIEKCDKMIFGNFYYAGGHGLIRNPEIHLFDADFDAIEGKEYEVEEARNAFKYEEKKGD